MLKMYIIQNNCPQNHTENMQEKNRKIISYRGPLQTIIACASFGFVKLSFTQLFCINSQHNFNYLMLISHNCYTQCLHNVYCLYIAYTMISDQCGFHFQLWDWCWRTSSSFLPEPNPSVLPALRAPSVWALEQREHFMCNDLPCCLCNC